MSAPEANGRHILIVEDDASVANTLVKLLEREGHVVHRAVSGEDAIPLIKHHTFALVVLDVGLPGMSGFEVLHEIRRKRSLERMPVLMLTGSGEDESIVRGFELGVTDYLIKPVESEELLTRVRSALGVGWRR